MVGRSATSPNNDGVKTSEDEERRREVKKLTSGMNKSIEYAI